MKPALMMVCDPRPQAAARTVELMVDAWCDDDRTRRRIVALEGSHWAIAAAAPPVNLPGSGAGFATGQGDWLIWTGDIQGVPASGANDFGYVLLGQLQARGITALAEQDGTFCGAWFDSRRGRWVVFNDRFGLLPLFYAVHEDRLVIGPTARLTFQAGDLPLEIDEQGVVDVLRSTNAIDERTLIRNVRWLQGAHVLEFDARATETVQLRTQPYWQFRHQQPTARTRQQAQDECLAVMECAFREHAHAGEDGGHVLLGLSGGLDGRLILAVAHSLGIVPDCYTVGWPFSEDVRFGRGLARVADADHTFVCLKEECLTADVEKLILETDGLHSAMHLAFGSPAPHYLRSHRGSVLLEGFLLGLVGGSGLPAEGDVPVGRQPYECDWALKHAHSGGAIAQINALLRPPLARDSDAYWKACLDERYAKAPGDNPYERAESVYVNGRCGRIDVLGTGLLRHDVLVRSPGTSRAVLDWCARTPIAWRRGKRLFMELLRRRFPAFARVQRTNYNGLPIAEGRLVREWAWQREKLHRFWAGWRWPATRRWGMGPRLVQASLFESWRKRGDLEQITRPDARVREWVRPEKLDALWRQAVADPGTSGLLLTLGTIETMVRALACAPRLTGSQPMRPLRFERIENSPFPSEKVFLPVVCGAGQGDSTP